MRLRVLGVAAGLGLSLAGSGAAVAEVAQAAPEGFVVVRDMVLDATPERAYQALTAEVSAWWDASHSYSGEADNFSLDATAGGCFCEALPAGGSVEHMRVVFASPGRQLRLMGGLGPLQGMGAAGPMDFLFSAHGDGQARLQFRYVVGGYVPDGLEAMAAPVDGVLGGQLARLAAYLEQAAGS